MAGDLDGLSDLALLALERAKKQATRLNHGYVGTEHILLALMSDEEGIPARALGSSGVYPDKVRAAVEFIIDRGRDEVSGEIALTARAKTVVELAGNEANQMGDQQVEPEHLLLGLVAEGEGIAWGILDSLGVRLPRLRRLLQNFPRRRFEQ